MRSSRSIRLLALAGLFALGAAAVWQVDTWTGRIFQQYTNTPTGSYSDFSQRWLGARVALFEGGDPYSPTLRGRIQELYYGRALGADEPHRPTDPQGFDYPLYLVWVIGPLALLPFPVASALFKALAAVLLGGGTYLYLTGLDWPGSRRLRALLAAGALATPAGLAVLRSDQLSVLVYGLLLGALATARRGHPGWAGALLAVAWIKPQLAAPLTLGLLIWAWSARDRRRFWPALIATGAALVLSSLLLQPGWLGEWLGALPDYAARTTGLRGFADYRALDWFGVVVRALSLLAVLGLWWRVRRLPLTAGATQVAVAGAFLVTLIVQQPWYRYNLILLIPPLLCLLAGLRGGLPGVPRPPRILGALAVAMIPIAWGVYGVLWAVYLAHLLPTADLGWPGFFALANLLDRALITFTCVILLFAYLAWAANLGPALPPSDGSGAAAQLAEPAHIG
jgi:hypothetical protein